MKFIDEVEIEISGGNGGSGCRHFRREKFVPLGGPDGGDGGHGGSVIIRADKNILTLLDFRHQPRWKADDGRPGQGSRKDGRSGDDLIIKVPVGTEIIDLSDGSLLQDLSADGSECVAAKGGRGGKGNHFFKSPTNRAPDHFQPGEPGEKRTIKLSLKLVADVGLIGLPNAGKSTLISRVSAAKPKIADYPFTTLVPNLGVVRGRDGLSFVMADIPGLIPEAHLGKGLGIKFLKHIERTKLLVHLVDVNQYEDDGNPRTIWNAFQEVCAELNAFSPELAAKPQLVAITKIDSLPDKEPLSELTQRFEKEGYLCFPISSVSGEGLQQLLDAVGEKLKTLT
ncbi:MAG: GTPase ObgE [Deltaproteobacteria bacterium]|nr:GTPase ObgE [Deltaproteobacteria bacterium]